MSGQRAASPSDPSPPSTTGPGVFSASATSGLGEVATRIYELSTQVWNRDRAVHIVGQSPQVLGLLERLAKIAPFSEPVLILGESGVGKELLAQALYLLSGRAPQPFVSVNCPQYQEGNLTVSELFGHKKGSFTGAVADRKGSFETAKKGAVFLDEIGDMHMSAQVMMLRTLATGEFQPLGSDRSKRNDARVIAATNRSRNELAEEKHFRRDLFFRLRYFVLDVPALREREGDWELLLQFTLDNLHRRHRIKKHFSPAALDLLQSYSWPGNVRELVSLVTSAYAFSDGSTIEPDDFVFSLEQGQSQGEGQVDRLFDKLTKRGGDFWTLVKAPFLARDLNRSQVRQLMRRGLRLSDGSYRKLLDTWNLPSSDYQKFMDFLRHHRLKPGSDASDAS